ncbi:caspase-3-like [Watersipora subatra]|uniref:caspase-3-like n=1 Tax=Watersipora subatra TaxID=2589382 RepID=UPI00355C85F5
MASAEEIDDDDGPIELNIFRRPPKESDSDISDIEDRNYIDDSDPSTSYFHRMKLNPVKRNDIKDLFLHRDEVYRMSDYCRGRMIIINNRNFTNSNHVRVGSEVDYSNIRYLFERLRFEIVQEDKEMFNLTEEEIIALVQAEVDNPYNNIYGIFGLVIMSYGGKGGQVYDRDGKIIDMMKILHMLSPRSCRMLKNKPKLVIVVTSPADEADFGVREEAVYVPPVAIPTELDWLVDDSMHLLFNNDDYVIVRALNNLPSPESATHGTWFVRVMVATFYMHCNHRDLKTLFNIVKQRLQQLDERHRKPGCPAMKLPTLMATMTYCRKVYLFPGFPAFNVDHDPPKGFLPDRLV